MSFKSDFDEFKANNPQIGNIVDAFRKFARFLSYETRRAYIEDPETSEIVRQFLKEVK